MILDQQAQYFLYRIYDETTFQMAAATQHQLLLLPSSFFPIKQGWLPQYLAAHHYYFILHTLYTMHRSMFPVFCLISSAIMLSFKVMIFCSFKDVFMSLLFLIVHRQYGSSGLKFDSIRNATNQAAAANPVRWLYPSGIFL